MKIMFNQLQTNSGTVNVSFDGGKTTNQYDNDAVRENGIPIPTFNCPGLDKIKISGSNKAAPVMPTSTEEIKAQFEVDSVKPDSINLEDLDAYLKSQPANTVDTPYKLNVNFGENSIIDLRNILIDNLNKFVDLSPTTFSGSLYGHDLFKGCENIVKIDLSKVTYTQGGMFANCSNLKFIDVSSIDLDQCSGGECAFDGCRSLKSVLLNVDTTNIGEYMFRDCESLTNISIPKNCSIINPRAFENCTQLKNINLPDSIKRIGFEAFNGSGITDVTLPKNLDFVDSYAFSNLNSLVIKSNVSVGQCAFPGVETIKFAGNVKSVMGFNLTGSAQEVTKIIFQNGVESIDYEAFKNSSNITEIMLPATLRAIGDCAFGGCGKLTTIKYAGTEAQWNNISLSKSCFGEKNASNNDPMNYQILFNQ